MSKSIQPMRVSHMNVVVENFNASVFHLRDLYGAEFLEDLSKSEWRACLVNIGDVIFELFVPHAFLLNARLGPHYLGIEYQADMEEVRAAVAAHKIRIIRDIGVALHTHPADCFGIAFEFFGENFHEWHWPFLERRMRPATYWREHPLGMAGLKAYTIAVTDIDAASTFLQSFLSAKFLYAVPRPALSARAVGLQIADSAVELLAPSGSGKLQQHLERFGAGIRSTVFRVQDIAQAKRYFTERKVTWTDGTAPDSIAVPAEENLGLIFEFSE